MIAMKNKELVKSAARLLVELGITSPDEIDIEAIAFHCGATVRYCPLVGCAARIVGNEHKAIITVDSNSSGPRRRFSAAHELGHWMYDRGSASTSCQESSLLQEWTHSNLESRANRYASDLLLPANLFAPLARAAKAVDFTAVRALAETFRTSVTATAIRLVEHGPLPAILVCYGKAGRKWFVRNSNIPEKLWPAQMPEADTCACELLKAAKGPELKGDVPAGAWFQHPSAQRHYIYENSLQASRGDVLTLLWWKNEQMLIDYEEYEERLAARRSDRRPEE